MNSNFAPQTVASIRNFLSQASYAELDDALANARPLVEDADEEVRQVARWFVHELQDELTIREMLIERSDLKQQYA